jgi:hypothetical protein
MFITVYLLSYQMKLITKVVNFKGKQKIDSSAKVMNFK